MPAGVTAYQNRSRGEGFWNATRKMEPGISRASHSKSLESIRSYAFKSSRPERIVILQRFANTPSAEGFRGDCGQIEAVQDAPPRAGTGCGRNVRFLAKIPLQSSSSIMFMRLDRPEQKAL